MNNEGFLFNSNSSIIHYAFFFRFALQNLVPRAGIEPAHLAVRDFKSLVSTISPPGQRKYVREYYIVFLFFSRDLLGGRFSIKIRQN